MIKVAISCYKLRYQRLLKEYPLHIIYTIQIRCMVEILTYESEQICVHFCQVEIYDDILIIIVQALFKRKQVSYLVLN